MLDHAFHASFADAVLAFIWCLFGWESTHSNWASLCLAPCFVFFFFRFLVLFVLVELDVYNLGLAILI